MRFCYLLSETSPVSQDVLYRISSAVVAKLDGYLLARLELIAVEPDVRSYSTLGRGI